MDVMHEKASFRWQLCVQHSCHSTHNMQSSYILFSEVMHTWEIPDRLAMVTTHAGFLISGFTSSALSTSGGGALACLGFSSAVALLSLGFCSGGLSVACMDRGHFNQLRVAGVVLWMAAGTSSNWQGKSVLACPNI